MKKLSLVLLTLAATSLSVLPATAMETEVQETSQQVDATEKIQQAITTAGCVYIPGYGWAC